MRDFMPAIVIVFLMVTMFVNSATRNKNQQTITELTEHTCSLYMDVATLVLELNEVPRTDMDTAAAIMETGPLYAGTIDLEYIINLCTEE